MTTLLAVLLFAATLQAPAQPAAGADAQALIERGLAHYKQGHLQAARQEFQKAVDADPQSAAAHFYLGYTLYKIAEPTKRLTPEKQQALEHFSRAFELDPKFVPRW
jgi:tetratricopeptide (TPR) repeat protein